jgi:hypothetical protein
MGNGCGAAPLAPQTAPKPGAGPIAALAPQGIHYSGHTSHCSGIAKKRSMPALLP